MRFTESGDVIAISDGVPFIVEDKPDLAPSTRIESYKKRLHYIVKNLIPYYLQHEDPIWIELMEVFLKYLDARVFQKIIGIQNVVNINNTEITNTLIDELYRQYGSGLVNEDLLELEEDDKKNIAQLGKYINNLKGTKLSLEYIFKYLAQSKIVELEDKKVFEYVLEEVKENKQLLEIDPNPNPKLFVSPFSYELLCKEIYSDLLNILKTVHPIGFKYTIVFDSLFESSETISVSADQGRVRKFYTNRYDGLYNYSGYYSGSETFSVQIKPILYTEGFSL